MRVSLAAIALLSFTAPAFAAGDGIAPEPLPINPEKIDFTGDWYYADSNLQHSGICPRGTERRGTLSITHSGSEVGVMIKSGMVCDPAVLCKLSGSIEDGQLVVSVTSIADSEGGSTTIAMRLFFTSDSSGGGEWAMEYVHPQASCHWDTDIALWRLEESE